jgi:ribosomal protein L16/L10AE
MLFEVDGVEDDVAKQALHRAGAKLPTRAKVIERNQFTTTGL